MTPRARDVSERRVRPSGEARVPAPAAHAPHAPALAAVPRPLEDGSPAVARTPGDAHPVPAPQPDGSYDLTDPGLFLNRELTWLNFNFRVLWEAEDERRPVLERVKFLAIASSNLDEFFMKRIGGLKQQVGAGLHEPTVDGRTPAQQIAECYAMVEEFEARRRTAFDRLVERLREAGIVLTTYDRLRPEEQEPLRRLYLDNVFPLVTPQATDPAHPFPFISNLSLNLLVAGRDADTGVASLARIKVPVGAGIPRFLCLPGTRTFVTLESVMAGNLDLLFPGLAIESCTAFRVTRNANTELDEEDDDADDLLATIESGLRKRKFAPIVRLQVGSEMPAHLRHMLASELALDEDTDVFQHEGVFGLQDVMEIARLEVPEHHDPPHHPIDHPAMETDRNVFHVIRDAGSVLVQHPYESFTTSVERFLREASRDPKVRAIKMTLYRTSADTKVIDYLIDAARNGKQVAVVVELKARFDEEANIRWANRLESAGIHVTYGVLGLKTHCKAILVVRQDFDVLRRYAHVGTGNYHAGTAREYSDIGLLTADPAVGRDLTELFNYLTTGYEPNRRYRKLLTSPKILKPALLRKIDREIARHRERGGGVIQMKMNALEDPEITSALYRASQAGVSIDLIVRDTCRIRPGVPGLSDTIRVLSVIGRFLEHARIYYFRNGGDEEYYIGSADCMRRNLDSRVEAVVPVEHPELRTELRAFLDAQLADNRTAWEMEPDGAYWQRRPAEGEEARGSHDAMVQRAERRRRELTARRRTGLRAVTRRKLTPDD